MEINSYCRGVNSGVNRAGSFVVKGTSSLIFNARYLGMCLRYLIME